MSNTVTPFIIRCCRRYSLFKVKNSTVPLPKTALNLVSSSKGISNIYFGTTSRSCINNVLDFQNHLKFHRSNFHTTVPKRSIPPVLWIVIRFTLKITAVIVGRSLRRWWLNLPPTRKQQIAEKITQNRAKIWIGSFAFSGFTSLYYFLHLEEDPITKRKQFLLISKEETNKIARMENEYIMKRLKQKITTSGQLYDTVVNITKQIVQSNKHLPGLNKKWEVFIINDLDRKNAFVLPSGHIYIYTGILQVTENTDQLAIVLAHEMAHTLLNHSAEVFSEAHFIEMLSIPPILMIWALLPDLLAFSAHFTFEALKMVLFQLPKNRRIEMEADVVGVKMAARACFDPRQAIVFWKNMESLGEIEGFEILATHPHYKKRYRTLERKMAELLIIRRESQCTQPLEPHN